MVFLSEIFMPWVTSVLLHYRIAPLKPWRTAPIHQLRKRQVPHPIPTTTSSGPRSLLINNRIRIPQKHPNTIKMPYPISQSAPSASLLIPPANPSTKRVCIKGQKKSKNVHTNNIITRRIHKTHPTSSPTILPTRPQNRTQATR